MTYIAGEITREAYYARRANLEAVRQDPWPHRRGRLGPSAPSVSIWIWIIFPSPISSNGLCCDARPLSLGCP